MARRIELGAGIAAAVLALFGVLALLFLPLPYCSVRTTGNCPADKVRSDSLFHLLQLYPDPSNAGIWAFLIVMLLLLLTGAGGAIVEARYGRRAGVVALWAGGILAFMGCAFFASSAGLFFLPSLLALALASYASLFQRRLARRAPLPPSADANAQMDPSGGRS